MLPDEKLEEMSDTYRSIISRYNSKDKETEDYHRGVLHDVLHLSQFGGHLAKDKLRYVFNCKSKVLRLAAKTFAVNMDVFAAGGLVQSFALFKWPHSRLAVIAADEGDLLTEKGKGLLLYMDDIYGSASVAKRYPRLVKP